MQTELKIDQFQATPAPLVEFTVQGPVVFDLDAELVVAVPGQPSRSHHSRASGMDISWLPRGRYRLECFQRHEWPPGTKLTIILRDNTQSRQPRELQRAETELAHSADMSAGWRLGALPGTVPVEQLSWARRDNNWFMRHFDHAARTVIHYLFDNHPALHGRILDVGCGDGITDLGIASRIRPELLIGIDPFRGYQRLPRICRDHHLPLELLDTPGLEYRDEDANRLSFDDNEFDVVLSWGSLEHIAGGYDRALAEIRRVLKPGGLFFAHPGLFYSSFGNHLGEFFDDPYIHLKLDRESLREKVLNGTPRYMDRAGEESSPAQYWQWYTELNPITVPGFEAELRALDFEPWRFGLRTEPMVEYAPEMQQHSMVDLGIRELYVVCVSRKSK